MKGGCSAGTRNCGRVAITSSIRVQPLAIALIAALTALT